MDWLPTIASVIVGFLLRLGLPIAVTILAVYFLHRLDKRWQAEAKTKNLPVTVLAGVNGKHCWEMKGCTEENQAKCPARKADQPCWQVFRASNGYLREECLICEFFKKTPAPASIKA